MELIVLGSSSAGNGYLLRSSSGESLLLETGISYKEFLGASDAGTNIVTALISHSHKDHSGKAWEYLAHGIVCRAPQLTNQELKIIHHNLCPVFPKTKYVAEQFTFMPFELVHDVQCYGYLINHPESGQIAFITDTLFCPYDFPSLRHLIIEANYSEAILESRIISGKTSLKVRDRVVTSHMSLETVIKYLKDHDFRSLRTITLIHLSDGNSDEISFCNQIRDLTGKAVYAANKGMKINLNSLPF